MNYKLKQIIFVTDRVTVISAFVGVFSPTNVLNIKSNN